MRRHSQLRFSDSPRLDERIVRSFTSFALFMVALVAVLLLRNIVARPAMI